MNCLCPPGCAGSLSACVRGAWRLAVALALALSAAAAWAQGAGLTQQALYERVRPSVVEVKIEVKGNHGISSSASGFITQRPDLVVTNYHAISEAVYEPEQHRISIHASGQSKLAARLLAIDVRHDLALLQLEQPLQAAPLTLRTNQPVKGENGYSMGKPGGYELGIVAGSFNGMSDNETTPLIVFSGPINAGMSGGPALDREGRVVGVNVASSTQHQLVGLLVPAQVLSELIQRGASAQPDNAQLRADIAGQIARFGQLQMQRMDSGLQTRRQLGPFTVRGDLADGRSCGTDRNTNPHWRFTLVAQRCQAAAGLYIMDKRYGGSINSSAFWLRGHGLNGLQMASAVERRLYALRTLTDDPTDSDPWRCTERRMNTPAGLTVHLHACRRPVPKLPGLHDYRFRYTPLLAGNDALVASMALSGFDEATAQAALRKAIASVRWNPPAGKEAP